MPKYGIHGIVLSQASTQLASGSGANTAALIDGNLDLAMLGAVGPDVFFWADDYEAVAVMRKLHDNIGAIVDAYEEMKKPVEAVGDAVGEVTEEVVGSLAPNTVDLIKQALQRLKDTASMFKSTVATGLFAGVLSIDDFFAELASVPPLSTKLFDLFVPPLQGQMEGRQLHDVKDWYWFDMLHYRRTGRFARNLVSGAGADDRLSAYAYGYLSHVATDVVGHAFINQVVSSPYRLNVQRHAVVENFMDAWAYDRYYGASVSKDLFQWMPLPAPNDVPAGVWQLLDQSFRNTYDDLHPASGFLSEDQIRGSYEAFHTTLTLLKRMVVERPEEPFSGVGDVLAAALDDLLEPPPSPPESDSSACGWDDIFSFGLTGDSQECYEGFFDELSGWMDYLGELLLWTFESVLDLIDLILVGLLAMPITVLLALLYEVQLLLYGLYQEMRYILALHGFVSPEPSDLGNVVGRSLTTTSLGCADPFKFPRERDPAKSHLACAQTQVESPTTSAGNHPSSGSTTPFDFIEGAPLDPVALAAYAAASSPAETRALQDQGKDIGSATALAAWQIQNAAADQETSVVFTDWNLDADRGYGYKTWDGALAIQNTVEPELYTT